MNPLYHQVAFIKSASKLSDAGRSNAGKSSALNALTGQSSLARTSKMPGRTQLLNFFSIDDERKFVDLPGYGYAKVAESIKKEWQLTMINYLQQRKALCGIVLVMDIRHPLTEFDWQMIQWCEQSQLKLHILLTKADKLKFGAAKNTLLKVQKDLGISSIEISLQLFSALKKTGVDDVHQVLDEWLKIDRQ